MNSKIHKKRTILIIDDSEELLDVLEPALKKCGYNVVVKSAPGNIEVFVQKTKIDLMLLDVRLENVSGKFICNELKSNPKTDYFPIILISAFAKYAASYKECGADDFLEKPFNLDELITKVNVQVHAHESHKN